MKRSQLSNDYNAVDAEGKFIDPRLVLNNPDATNNEVDRAKAQLLRKASNALNTVSLMNEANQAKRWNVAPSPLGVYAPERTPTFTISLDENNKPKIDLNNLTAEYAESHPMMMKYYAELRKQTLDAYRADFDRNRAIVGDAVVAMHRKADKKEHEKEIADAVEDEVEAMPDDLREAEDRAAKDKPSYLVDIAGARKNLKKTPETPPKAKPPSELEAAMESRRKSMEPDEAESSMYSPEYAVDVRYDVTEDPRKALTYLKFLEQKKADETANMLSNEEIRQITASLNVYEWIDDQGLKNRAKELKEYYKGLNLGRLRQKATDADITRIRERVDSMLRVVTDSERYKDEYDSILAAPKKTKSNRYNDLLELTESIRNTANFDPSRVVESPAFVDAVHAAINAFRDNDQYGERPTKGRTNWKMKEITNIIGMLPAEMRLEHESELQDVMAIRTDKARDTALNQLTDNIEAKLRKAYPRSGRGLSGQPHHPKRPSRGRQQRPQNEQPTSELVIKKIEQLVKRPAKTRATILKQLQSLHEYLVQGLISNTDYQYVYKLILEKFTKK